VNSGNSFFSSVGGVLFDKCQTELIQYPSEKVGSSYLIPNSVSNIGDYAFDQCTSLTNVTIPTNVTSIGDGAFESCTLLASVTIPNSVTSIGDYTFQFCTVLTNVTIPASVTSIGDGAFESCTLLASVTIPNSVISIGAFAFGACTSLNNLTIPNSVTNFGCYAFWYCTSLTNIYCHGNAPSVDADWSMFYGNNNNVTVYYPPNTTDWGSSFGGRPTILFNPQIQPDATFGIHTTSFGFTFTNAGSPTVVIEACTNLTNPVWIPISTNTLTTGSSYFSDPQWTNFPARFYRFQMP